MTTATAPSPLQVVTGEVRLSYAYLLRPRAQGTDDEAKYSCMLIIPKTDKTTIKKIRAAELAAISAMGAKTFGTIPRKVKSTLRDGDEEGDLDKSPELEGCMFMNVSSKRKPGLINIDKSPITSEDDMYSGCYARIAMGAFCYNQQGNKGTSFGLNHVMKTRDGERLDGQSRAEDVFADYFEDDEGDEDTDDLL